MFLAGALKLGVLAALFMPFVFVNSLTFPFITGKVFYFRILVEILIAGYLILIMIAPAYRPRRTALMIAIGVWAASLVASTVFGVDAGRSFWGNHERMLGVFTLLHYAALALVAGSILWKRKEWDQALFVALLFSAVMSLMGLYERYSDHTVFLNPNKMRVWTTLGNSIYYGHYMLFHFYFALILLAGRFKSLRARGWARLIPLALMGSAALSFIGVLLSGSRGEFVGFAVGLAGFIVYGSTRLPRYRRAAYGILGVLGMSALLLFIFKPQAVINKIPSGTVQQVLNLSLRGGGGVSTRYIGWDIALQAFRQRPVFGYGPENFYIAFNRNYNPASLRYGFYETWFDRSHNAFLDALSTTGIVGTLAWLGLFGAAFWTLARAVRRSLMTKTEGAIAASLLVAHFTQNLFVFEAPSSYLLLFLLFGWIHARALSPREGEAAAGSWVPLVHGTAAAFIFGGFLVLVFLTNVQAIRANKLALLASAYFRVQSEPAIGVEYYERALNIPTPHAREIRTDFGREVGILMEKPEIDAVTAKKMWEPAAAAMRANIARRGDVYDFIQLGQVAVSYSRFDSTVLPEAIEVLRAAIPLSPRRQQIYFALGKAYLQAGQKENALETLKTAVELDPSVPDSHWFYGLTLIIVGEKVTGAVEIARAIELHYTWKAPGEILFAGNALLEAGRFAEAHALFEIGIKQFGAYKEFVQGLERASSSIR